MKTKKTPAPKRAGTATKKAESVPQWVVDELRGNPELLRDVASIVRERSKRSLPARLIRRR